MVTSLYTCLQKTLEVKIVNSSTNGLHVVNPGEATLADGIVTWASIPKTASRCERSTLHTSITFSFVFISLDLVPFSRKQAGDDLHRPGGYLVAHKLDCHKRVKRAADT